MRHPVLSSMLLAWFLGIPEASQRHEVWGPGPERFGVIDVFEREADCATTLKRMRDEALRALEAIRRGEPSPKPSLYPADFSDWNARDSYVKRTRARCIKE